VNTEQRQTAADLWTRWWWMYGSFMAACIHRHHLLLLSPKADTHFTIPQRRG